ncbi:argininosuccinate lyase [Bordetella genomosp. 10]|uniref:Argininosuccinate lyase n=1 Tax=Bordetella genomosp. 10 TaxID=1416804 RepID=A0A261RZZ5_9BORD|nr:argininosuccinate lyase [Bordetella genomosp. 10]OZI30232.1 argininosuccinate lyase [Bordetella genomosp. 10]
MGRLKSEAKAPELVEYVMAPFLADMGQYFDAHLRIHKAHVVMLCEQRLVDAEEGGSILAALREMERAGPEGLALHHDTDLYMQMEAYVSRRAPKAGGKMHMGRSRNDLYACGARLLTRDRLAALIADLLDLQEAVLARAEEHAVTVMPGYTHLQHAEPITLGHFLLAFHDALARDLKRLAAAYDNANQNALGSSALAGSSFPLDRERTAALLGFDGLVENSYDAVAARDYVVEAMGALAVMASTVARVVDTLIIWCTSEFGMIDMPDSYGYTSSIMPQKRNPGYFLESVRCKSARITGDMSSALCTLKGTTFAQSRDTSFEITIALFRAFGEARGIVNVMRGVARAMIVNADAMQQNCAREFSGATEIANFLVRERALNFRSAYMIVANTVRLACERGLGPAAVTPALVDEAAREVLGRPVDLPEPALRQALSPAANVELKRTAGSPSRSEVLRMLERRQRDLARDRAEHQARRDRLARADGLLETAIDALAPPARA